MVIEVIKILDKNLKLTKWHRVTKSTALVKKLLCFIQGRKKLFP